MLHPIDATQQSLIIHGRCHYLSDETEHLWPSDRISYLNIKMFFKILHLFLCVLIFDWRSALISLIHSKWKCFGFSLVSWTPFVMTYCHSITHSCYVISGHVKLHHFSWHHVIWHHVSLHPPIFHCCVTSGSHHIIRFCHITLVHIAMHSLTKSKV